MSKKVIALLLTAIMMFSLVGCGSKETGGSSNNFKIGVVTGTVSQGEEEYNATVKVATELKEKYGRDVIQHVTYPDKFMQEQETTISQITGLAADPNIKAIIIAQAVPGSAAAIDKVKETREDILFIGGVPHESPSMVSERFDIILEVDNLKRGETILNLAKEMGAKNFVHYSFPRHMAMELLAERKDIMEKTANKLGIKFIEVDAPDPVAEGGIAASQQFIIEDVPRQVASLGAETAFFNTNCAMQEPLIKSVLDTGSLYPEQCCPSPYHAYPGALALQIPQDKTGDISYILEEIKSKVGEKQANGRFATWKSPANMSIINAAVEYSLEFAEGKVGKNITDNSEESKNNKSRVIQLLGEKAGAKIEVDIYKQGDKEYPNFLMFVTESEIF